MERGEKVKLQSGLYQGKTGEVVEVDWESGMATVEIEGFGESREIEIAVREVQSLSGSDEELVEEVATSVRRAVWQAFEVRQQVWWAKRAADGAEPSEDLLESFREFRESMFEDYDRKVDEELEAARQTIEEGRSASEWLSDEADILRRRWLERAEETERECFTEVTPDDELQRLESDAEERAADSSFLDAQAARQQIIQRRSAELLDEGLRLWQACKNLAETS